jgi:hypothetical protein
VLADRGCNGVERVWIEDIGKAAVMRGDVADMLEGALLVGLPDMQRAATERASNRNRHTGGLFAVDGFYHHAPVVPVACDERDIAAGGKLP